MRSDVKDRICERVASALDAMAVRRGARIMVALSGGADSVALLYTMLAMRERRGLVIAAAHFNHRIRGAESDRDEEFVRGLCARLAVELVVGRARGLAEGQANLEERAREARHDFLRRAAQRTRADHIALGHNRDDQAETVLMRLMRGTGVAGLAAMAAADPRRRLIRPLLEVPRAEIAAFLAATGASWVEDRSNSSARFLRNRVRAGLVPIIERDYAPDARRRLAELAEEARAVEQWIQSEASRELDRPGADGPGGVEIAALIVQPRALGDAMLREMVRRRGGSLRGFERAHIAALRRLIEKGPPNGRVDLPAGLCARRRYGRIAIVPAPGRARRDDRVKPGGGVKIAFEGTTAAAGGFRFEASLQEPDSIHMPADLFEAIFDAGALRDGLMAGAARAGQRVAPLGMRGERKLQDVFVDRKVARELRANWPVVSAGDTVAWLPGLVRGRVALVEASTRSVLRLRAVPKRESRLRRNRGAGSV